MKFSIDLKKSAKVVLSSAMMLSALGLNNLPVAHAETRAGDTTLNKVDSATVNKNVVNVSFNDGAINGKITFLENGIFRYNVDPEGDFGEYATPNETSHTATIQAQSDNSDKYHKPTPTVTDAGTAFEIKTNEATIVLDKATAKMSIKNKAGAVIMEEKESLTLGSKTVQKLATSDDEYFFGGGTQNGRFTHKGKKINIATENKWVDGNVSSPNPFYWSTDGYGVLRNTFKPGSYDFGNTSSNVVSTTHNENEFDAYYFVANESNVAATADTLLNDYFEVTGNPMLLPEYAFYLAHLNCYNRDTWSDTTGGKAWTMEDGTTSYESGMSQGHVIAAGDKAETLNNTGPTVDASKFVGTIDNSTYKYSARKVVDGHVDYDMPLGWFLPNDGYGCGYGQNGYYQASDRNTTTSAMTAAIEANVANLKEFTKYAESKGVRSGLWTQAALTPDTSLWDGGYQGLHTLRDFQKEVSKGGVSALKTDVAWVGQGYSMALNSVKDGYNILASSGKRPTVVSLDGWAGFQRYASVWTGDQTGGNWEYIRFHIPTYIGQSLSGNPNIGSDVDGIFGGSNLITTRDLQFKTFTQTMLDMDGWGSIAKKPYNNGDPYTSINRMYLKLKAQLMPYIYTEAINATDGLPMIRAMFLEEANDYTYGTATQYQYMFGDNFLVAPVYQDTNADAKGNDVRNNIYLPSNTDVWVDYFTGKQYRGGQVVNNFDAPIWKLPLFVKNGAIIPMYEENNNPMAATTENAKGLDKTRRIIEFYPYGDTSYQLKEDDGITLDANETDNGKKYGGRVITDITSSVNGTTATLTANASTGNYAGYVSNRHSTFVVNVSQRPTGITAKNGATNINATEANTLEEFETKAANNEAVWFYDATPNLNKYALDGENFKNTAITTTPKLYVSFTKTDVNANAQTLVVNGFVNDGNLGKDELNGSLAVPTNVHDDEPAKTPNSIQVAWNKVNTATSYDVKVDGVVNTVGDVDHFNHADLAYHSTHRYQVRARNLDGYSDWSQEVVITSLEDPWRNTPDPVNITWSGKVWGSHTPELAFDKTFQTGSDGFHSNYGGVNETLIVDYGKAYQWDKIEYYPRDDKADGTVKKMEFSTSMDGVHWSDPVIYEFDWPADTVGKIVCSEIPVNTAARYFRFIPRECVNVFFAASEIKPIKKDNTSAFAVGSTNLNAEVVEGDYTNMKNYLGTSTKDGAAFVDQIQNRFGDINMNNVYDVYDYAFTMFKMNGGTKKQGPISGNVFLLANSDNVEAGKEFTVEVYADHVKNLNAVGQVINYDPSKVEVVGVEQGITILQMEDLCVKKEYPDGTAYLNLAYANNGNKNTFNGSGSLATITFRAKQAISTNDVAVIDLSKATLIGPDYSFIESEKITPEFPEEPKETINHYGLDDMDITMTNDSLKTDDGTNFSKLIQDQSGNGIPYNYSVLFNGSKGRELEFLWDTTSNYVDGALPEYVKTPLTLHFNFHEAKTLNEVNVYNSNKANGYVVKGQYTITYEDDSKEVLPAITLEDAQRVDYAPFKAEITSDKKVKLVEFEVQEVINAANAPVTNMMTLAEVDFTGITTPVKATGIEPAESNKKEIYVGKLSDIQAVITPDDAAYKYFTVVTSDPSVASIITLPDENGAPTYKVKGMSVGRATITLALKNNPSVTATYEVTVIEGIDTTMLEEAIEKGKAISPAMYTKESYANLAKALEDGHALLLTDSYTEKDIAIAANTILEAIDNLVNRPLNENNLINTSADTDVSVIDYSSYEPAENPNGAPDLVLDYDEQSFWHSSYMDASKMGMPQWLTFDLGKEYTVTDVTVLARQAPGYHGDITKAEILTSLDGTTFTKAGTYTFEKNPNSDHSQIIDRDQFQRMQIPPITARYIKINILGATGDSGDDQFVCVSEVRFYGTTPIDTSALQTLYNQYKDAEDANYTPASWAMLQNALADAKNVLDDIDATQEDVDTVYARLQAAVQNLAKIADFTKLNEAINKAEKADTSKYTSSSVAKLDVALLEAKKVASDLNATQKEVDDATNLLNAAIKALEPIGTGDPNKPVTPDKPGNNGSTTIGGNGNILVNTGDDTNITLWVMMLVLASGIALFAYKKRKEEANN